MILLWICNNGGKKKRERRTRGSKNQQTDYLSWFAPIKNETAIKRFHTWHCTAAVDDTMIVPQNPIRFPPRLKPFRSGSTWPSYTTKRMWWWYSFQARRFLRFLFQSILLDVLFWAEFIFIILKRKRRKKWAPQIACYFENPFLEEDVLLTWLQVTLVVP